MKSLIYGWFVAMAFSVTGAEYFLKSGVTDWSIKESYCTDSARTVEATGVPGSEDTIFVPAGTFSLVSGTDSFNTFANVKRIAPEATNTVIELDVVGGTVDQPVRLNAMVFHDLARGADRLVGTVVKKGSGFLELMAKDCADAICRDNSQHYEYAQNWDVRAGNLRFPKDCLSNTYYGVLTIASGATVWMPQSPNNATQAYFHLIKAEEGSVITNATTRDGTHVFGAQSADGKNNEESYIKGQVTGKARVWTYGSIRLEGTENTMSGAATVQENVGYLVSTNAGKVRGVLSVKKFGMKSDAASSISTAPNLICGFGSYGGVIRYLGTGETTDRNFNFYGKAVPTMTPTLHPSVVDGGETGKLTLTGSFQFFTDSSNLASVRRLWFSGDHAEPCVYAGSMYTLVSGGTNFPCYITKTGTGTWRFAENADRQHTGGTAVLDGTLQFDSIAEKGEMCALGLSTILTPDEALSVQNDNYVDYAFVLGGQAGGHPVFEYTGQATAACETRPLVLAGEGGTLRASAGTLTFGGVSARDAGSAPTLTLDGTGTENTIKNVSDGADGAHLKLAKSGTGTWHLAGDHTFSGGIDVQEGTLGIQLPKKAQEKPFKWYRISFAQLGTPTLKSNLSVRKIALFDKDGNRQNAGLVCAVSETNNLNMISSLDAVDILPGQAYYDKSLAGLRVVYGTKDFEGGHGLEAAFDNVFSGDYGKLCATFAPPGGANRIPNPADSSTWIPIIMHLADDANPVTHFDVQGFGQTNADLPTRIVLEGSTDGLVWEELYSNLEGGMLAANNTGWNQWISDGVGASAGQLRPLAENSLVCRAASGLNRETFSYFRLSVAKIYKDGNQLNIRTVGLYDAFGTHLNPNLTMAEDYISPAVAYTKRTIVGTMPEPGEIGYGSTAAGKCIELQNNLEGELAILTDGHYNNTNGLQSGIYNIKWLSATGSTISPNPVNRNSWIPIVMHLARPVVVDHFDIQLYNNNLVAAPVRFMLEGSSDGVAWTTLFDNATQGEEINTTPSSYNCWLSDGVNATDTSHARPKGKGFATVAQYAPDEPDTTLFPNGTAVAVAPGATFLSADSITYNALTLDVQGLGTISGGVFATEGTLNLTGFTGDSVSIPVDFTYVHDSENLTKWSLMRDGAPMRRGRIVVRDGAINVLVPGTTIYFR